MAQEVNTSIEKEYTARISGTTAVAYTLNPKFAFQLMDFRAHIVTDTSTTASESLTLTADHHSGTPFDILLYTKSMVAVTDIYRSFDRMRFVGGDEVDFAWANTNSKTWGLEVKYRRLT